jgi:hypothetical protein
VGIAVGSREVKGGISLWQETTNINKDNNIVTTETISKLFRKYLCNIPRYYESKEIQKTAILSTGHILLKELI